MHCIYMTEPTHAILRSLGTYKQSTFVIIFHTHTSFGTSLHLAHRSFPLVRFLSNHCEIQQYLISNSQSYSPFFWLDAFPYAVYRAARHTQSAITALAEIWGLRLLILRKYLAQTSQFHVPSLEKAKHHTSWVLQWVTNRWKVIAAERGASGRACNYKEL